MTDVLSVKNLAKSYKMVRALNGVSFDVPEGSVYGILGPNGSGKTTLLGIVMNVLRANSGEFSWFGKPGGSSEQRKKIGSLLETPNFYSYLNAVENLRITQTISGRGNENDILDVLKKVNLFDRRRSSFKSFSLGMKQRLAIAAALLGNPAVLVLDEPTNGLDPVGIAEIRNLITELNKQGHTIIMASHLLDEVEKVCTHATILKSGNVITTAPVDEILADEDILEVSAADINRLMQFLATQQTRHTLDEKTKTVQLFFSKGFADPERFNRLCFDNGITLTRLVILRKRLETRFFELTNN